MLMRSSIRESPDMSQIVASIIENATGQTKGKNPAAVALGRLGGLKGGKARALKLSPKKRSIIARKAAVKRWAARSAVKKA